MNPKRLHQFVDEFQGRLNNRPGTKMQMENVVRGSADERLRFQDLIAGGAAYPKSAES